MVPGRVVTEADLVVTAAEDSVAAAVSAEAEDVDS
jgi:hypothetical protein